jgi:hypothetical protein
MAKPKSTPPTPQPQHKTSRPSQHDRRTRLTQPNPNRQHSLHAQVPLVGALAAKVEQLATALDARLAFRLAMIVAGMMLADDRRTASAWFVAAGVRDDWDCFYHTLRSIGRKAEKVAAIVLRLIVAQLAPGVGGRITLALDDTPEKRYGKHVEGAGVHHDPTAGPAGGEFCYGHNWVTLAWLAKHPLWGTLALPIRSLLYVRQIDVPLARR